MIPLRWEQSRIASATSATGLTVGCTDSLLLDVPLRTFWPPYSQTFDLFRPKRPSSTLLICGAVPFLNTNTSSCRDRYSDPMPAFVLLQTQRFLVSEVKSAVPSRSARILARCVSP